MKKIVFLMLIAAVAAPLFLKGPDGEPIMKLSDWLPSKDISITAPDTGASQSYFRYKDASGHWQYTDSPPADVAYEAVNVDSSANIIQSTPVQDKPDLTKTVPAAGVAGYVDNLQSVMQDAGNVQQLMDDRSLQMEQQLKASQ